MCMCIVVIIIIETFIRVIFLVNTMYRLKRHDAFTVVVTEA